MEPSSSNLNKDDIWDWSCKNSDMRDMAEFFMKRFRGYDNVSSSTIRDAYAKDVWEDVFENIDWLEGGQNIDNPTVKRILQDDMTLADRKFLYGFLKGCFANKSQLFLIFVRAESAAGGGGAGSGARAVALVWRDPSAPMDASGQYKKADGSADEPAKGKDNGSKYLYVGDSGGAEETWRLNKRDYPPHKMRILFYHQLD